MSNVPQAAVPNHSASTGAAPTHPATAPVGHPSTSAAPSGSTCSHQDCEVFQLITWQDPVKTGKVFGAVVLALIALKKGNPLNWFFHVAYIGFILVAIAEYAGKIITGQGLVLKYKPASHKSLSPRLKNEVLPAVADAFAKFEDKFLRVAYGQDFECTLRAAGMSFLLYKITSWFSLYTLVTFAVLVIFTVPAIYVRNKKEIDAAVSHYTKVIKEKTGEATKDIRKQLQPHIDNLAKKSGPVGNFFQQKFPTRTAGSTVGASQSTSYGTGADAHTASAPAHAASSGVSTHATSAAHSGASQFPNVPQTNLGSSVKSDDLDQLAKDIHANASTIH